MDKVIAKKWVDALRSGEYEQATGTLRREGIGYCCLGVLCEVAVKDGVIPPGEYDGGENFIYGDDRDQETSELPLTVQGWADTETCSPYVKVKGFRDDQALIHLNDGLGYSFDEIADVIEYNYLTEEKV